MIQLQGLQKKFGKRVAVENLDLEIPEGTLYGLLGHNGAGKSTSIGMMLGQVIPDAGRVLIGGKDVQLDRKGALRQVGAIFETPSFYDYLSGWRNLEIFCAYSGVTSPTEMQKAVELVGMEKRIHDSVKAYSHGMRQRLALAQALVPRPKVLILDEPSEGLDPEGIYEMREMIRKLHAEFKLTIIVCSHLLAELELICEQVGVMREGRLLFHGSWKATGAKTLEEFYLKIVRDDRKSRS
jgi:ABC-2 type transport system ATP-binding protein